MSKDPHRRINGLQAQQGYLRERITTLESHVSKMGFYMLLAGCSFVAFVLTILFGIMA